MVPPAQGGSQKRLPLSIPMHYVRLHADALRQNKQTGALLFVDGSNAFYSIVREHLYGVDALSDVQRIEAFIDSVCSSDEHKEVVTAVLFGPGILKEAGVPSALRQYLRHTLSASWFCMDGSCHHMFQTATGTSPGTPLADLLYQFSTIGFHTRATAELDAHGLLCKSPVSLTPSPIPGWADDIAVLITSPSPECLMQRVGQATRIVQKCLASTGVHMNFAPGKTEVVPFYFGPGSRTARRHDLVDTSLRVPLSLEDGRQVELRVVDCYQHLGGQVVHNGSSAQDIARRSQEAEPVYRRLRSTLLCNRQLQVQEKVYLLQTLVFAKFLHGAGMWHFYHEREWKSFVTAYVSFLRRSTHCVLAIAPQHVTDDELCCLFGVLDPQECLDAERVVQLAAIAQFGESWLFEALQSAPNWLSAAWDSLARVLTVCQVEIQVPPLEQATFWLQGRELQLRRWARRFRLAVRKMRQSRAQDVAKRVREKEALRGRGSFFFRASQLCRPDGSLRCEICGQHCKSALGLAAHKTRIHHIYPAAAFGVGTTCQVCMTECWSGPRLRDHLRRHANCAHVWQHSDISAGHELPTRWQHAWQPCAKVAGPSPWWATLQPPQEEPPLTASFPLHARLTQALRTGRSKPLPFADQVLALFRVLLDFSLAAVRVQVQELQLNEGQQLAWNAAAAVFLHRFHQADSEALASLGWKVMRWEWSSIRWSMNQHSCKECGARLPTQATLEEEDINIYIYIQRQLHLHIERDIDIYIYA